MAPSTKISIVLKGEENWFEWVNEAETVARTADIWEYIDPEVRSEDIPKLSPPKEPRIEDVLVGSETPSSTETEPQADPLQNITPLQFQKLSYLTNQYQVKEKRYLAKKALIQDMRAAIYQSILADYVTYTSDCVTTHEIIRKLRDRFKPSTQARERQLIREYHSLRQADKAQKYEPWLLQWDIIVKKCRNINLPETQGSRPLFDFVEALQADHPTFFAVWNIRLIEGSHLPEVHQLINIFRDYLKSINPAAKHAKRTAFMASLGETPDRPEEPKGAKPRCVCGRNHQFKDCWHLNPSQRPENWRFSPKIEAKIQEILKKNKKIREVVLRDTPYRLPEESTSATGKIAAEAKDQENLQTSFCAINTENKASEPTEGSSWSLRDSFILDSGSNLHICRDKTRFKTFDYAPHTILAGGGNVQMLGYGDIDIVVQHPEGERKVTLKKVSYNPDFPGNLVSLKKANQSNILWDQTRNQLVQGNRTWCTIQEIDDHYVVEYRPVPGQKTALFTDKSVGKSASKYAGKYAKSTLPPPPKPTSLVILHRRFAHAGIEAIKQLPKATQGIETNPKEVENLPPASERPICEICGVSKAKKQISRIPKEPPTAPYEVVAMDLLEQKGSPDSKRLIHFNCRLTGMNHVWILPNKSQQALMQAIRDFAAWVRTRWDLKIRIFQLDGEKALGRDWQSWLATEGISEERSSPYTPEQNGGAERSGGVIMERSRCLQIDSNLPEHMWTELTCTAAYILNRTPQQEANWKTPWERLSEYKGVQQPKPKCGHMRIIGSKAYALKHNIPKTDKLSERADIGYLVGYDSTNIFRVWIPTLKRVIRTRDVVFDEYTQYNPMGQLVPKSPEVVETIKLYALEEPEQDDEIEDFQAQIANYGPFTVGGITPSEPKRIEKTARIALPTPEATPEPQNQLATQSVDEDTIVVDTSPNMARESLIPEASPNSSQTDTTTPSLDITRSEDTEPGSRKLRDKSQGVDSVNIQEGKRKRIPSRRTAYLATLEEPEELTPYHTAFLANYTTNTRKRIHRDELPPPPMT
jgi:hypothetical protein